MKTPSLNAGLRLIAICLLLIAALLVWQQYVLFDKQFASYPEKMLIAGVQVGGLDRAGAEERLRIVYLRPIEFVYLDQRIIATPENLGFQLDTQTMLDQADAAIQQSRGFSAFWGYLWNRSTPESKIEIPLSATVSESGITSFLQQEVAARYDIPATTPLPIPAEAGYSAGHPGRILDIERSASLIKAMLLTRDRKPIDLPVTDTTPNHPIIQNLQIQLQQILDVSSPDMVAEIYLKDLQSGDVVHFARNQGGSLSPDIAYTAASTIKIPIMISTFARTGESPSEEAQSRLSQMISVSENEPADWLMQNVLGGNLGPLEVTEDMRDLGLQNTFLAGNFYLGAPLLQIIDTPANTRSDTNLHPDPYNQTTPADMGLLLEGIKKCADNGSGMLVEEFSPQVTPKACRQMVELLESDRLPYLITAGLPEGTKIAHKHGWIEETDGLLHTMSDVAIVTTPGGSYILSIYLYHPVNLVFDHGNFLISKLSSAVYNYFNVR